MRRILLVDDNVELCYELGELFREEGFLVDSSSDSAKGADLIRKNSYDVCVLDYKMKGLNGIDLLKIAKEVNPRCTVFIISGRSFIDKLIKEENVSGLVAGIIPKPFNIKALLKKIRAAASVAAFLIVFFIQAVWLGPAQAQPGGKLSQVKVAVLYENITDGVSLGRSPAETINLLKATRADMIFRGFWKWEPVVESPGDIPIFSFIDWSNNDSQIVTFSQELDSQEQSQVIKNFDAAFSQLGINFVYPLHGGYMGSIATKLSFGKSRVYDSLAPEFDTYATIKTLAQKK